MEFPYETDVRGWYRPIAGVLFYLAPKERLKLIGDLWESLCAQPETIRLSSAQKADLHRRLDSLDRGTAQVFTWDEAKRRLRG